MSDDHAPAEHVNDVFALPQSSGRVLPGGDCGYCCIAGLFGLPTILSAYEFSEANMPEGGWSRRSSMDPFRWAFLVKSLGLTYREFRPGFEHYKEGCLIVPWGNIGWRKAYRTRIAKGDVLVASIRFNRSAPPPPHTSGEHDHNVLLNGWRRVHRPNPRIAGVTDIDEEVRISCSQRGTYWLEWSEFLYWHFSTAHCVRVDAARSAAARFLRTSASRAGATSSPDAARSAANGEPSPPSAPVA